MRSVLNSFDSGFIPAVSYAVYTVQRGPRRVTRGNKLAPVLTTVQADICDGKLWPKGESERERERTRAEREKRTEETINGEKKERRGWRRDFFQHVGGGKYFIYELFHLSQVF